MEVRNKTMNEPQAGVELDTQIALALGAACARCDAPGRIILSNIIYCSASCGMRISDFALDDYEQARPRYSTDREASSLILEDWRGGWNLRRQNEIYCCTFFQPFRQWEAIAETEPLAICRARLLALKDGI